LSRSSPSTSSIKGMWLWPNTTTRASTQCITVRLPLAVG
jgi:hypothetical protein